MTIPIFPLQLDIGFYDLILSVFYLFMNIFYNRNVLEKKAVQAFGLKEEEGLALQSVRTSLDLYIQAKNFEKGSRVILSGINIPTMVTVLQHHGLLTHPVPIDKQKLSMTAEDLEKAILASKKPIAFIILCHLFGRRCEKDDIFKITKKYNIEVFEDCAEAFDGRYKGDDRATLSAFSFGTIKTCTCTHGAMIRINDVNLRNKMYTLNSTYPMLPTLSVIQKVLVSFLLYFLLNWRFFHWPIRAIFNFLQKDPLKWGTALLRNFGTSSSGLIKKLRRQTSKTNLMIMNHRFQNFDIEEYDLICAKRLKMAKSLEKIDGIEIVGLDASVVKFWLFTILAKDRKTICKELYKHGIEAYESNSQLNVVPVSDELKNICKTTQEVWEIINHTIYLPIYSNLKQNEFNMIIDGIKNVMKTTTSKT